MDDNNAWFEQVRDKVSYIMVLRSMARPAPQNSNRKKLVENAVETVLALKGTISPMLTFFVLKVSPEVFLGAEKPVD